jgi:hypothetical protein
VAAVTLVFGSLSQSAGGRRSARPASLSPS